MPRPLNLMCLVFDFDKEFGKDLEEGLTGLKTIMEKRWRAVSFLPKWKGKNRRAAFNSC
jgi:hypothetical protein